MESTAPVMLVDELGDELAVFQANAAGDIVGMGFNSNLLAKGAR